MEVIVIAVVVGLVCALLAHRIAGTQLAAVIGFLLGPIGVLIACFIKKDDK